MFYIFFPFWWRYPKIKLRLFWVFCWTRTNISFTCKTLSNLRHQWKELVNSSFWVVTVATHSTFTPMKWMWALLCCLSPCISPCTAITKQYLIHWSVKIITLFTIWRVKDTFEKTEEGYYACKCSFVYSSWNQPMMNIKKKKKLFVH